MNVRFSRLLAPVRPAQVVACAVGALGLTFCAGVTAAGPPPALLKAVQRTNSATSENISLVERVIVGGQTTEIHLRGVEQPKATAGSFVLDTSPAQPGLGEASEIMLGSKLYIHYPVLDTLHAKQPAIKSWIVVDTNSALGVDPSSITAFQGRELQSLTNVKVAGTGTEGGVPVTRYSATLDLGKARQSGPMQQMLSHLPSAAASILNGTARMELWAGADGYLRRTMTTLSLPVPGDRPIRISIDATIDGFDQSTAPIVAPQASDVMTLAQFGQLTGTSVTPSATDTALLQKVVLAPSQIGAGFKLSQIPGGHDVQGEVTLDFCDATYPSEALRSARLQVAYAAKGNSFSASNEVVTYKPGGAGQALAEVAHEVTICPNGAVKNPPSGVTNMVRHTRLVQDPNLLPGALAILETDSGVVRGKPMTYYSMAVYQVRGNVLSGVYGSGPSDGSVQAHTLRAAEQSAANLKKYG